ncbi:unnamed protein product [Phytophthora lilii]|uniref:Unnamed protein product n=1 Tax=Phytophthora lilii TaxID=2077276 RepID=A0A9W6X4H5_9STRA|nr:unnamed protein product [Phytophthora lilii]
MVDAEVNATPDTSDRGFQARPDTTDRGFQARPDTTDQNVQARLKLWMLKFVIVLTVLNRLVRGEWIGNPTGYPEWMPADCDLQWFVDKAWDNCHYFSDIHNSMSTRQQLDRVDKKINMLRWMAIICEENRELPALWTAERLPTRTGFMVRVKMLSSLSGRCFHDPIDISVLPELIGAYGNWIQVGVAFQAQEHDVAV